MSVNRNVTVPPGSGGTEDAGISPRPAADPNPLSTAFIEAAQETGYPVTEDFNGVLGTWSFDDDGDTSLTELSVQRVENGQFEYQRTIDAGEM